MCENERKLNWQKYLFCIKETKLIKSLENNIPYQEIIFYKKRYGTVLKDHVYNENRLLKCYEGIARVFAA